MEGQRGGGREGRREWKIKREGKRIKSYSQKSLKNPAWCTYLHIPRYISCARHAAPT